MMNTKKGITQIILLLVVLFIVGIAVITLLSGSSQDSSLVSIPERLATTADFDPPKASSFDPSTIFLETVSVENTGDFMTIKTTAIPDHDTGNFPNPGNPNAISEQDLEYKITLSPQLTGNVSQNTLEVFGIAINGVPFEPGAAEWWQNNRNSGWQYEATSGAINLGIDEYGAHVQPTGKYHYHDLSMYFTENLSKTDHSPIVGYAADGFPIYALYGYSNPQNTSSGIKELTSSYKLKEGTRPSGPGGTYNGSFIQDYEYVNGLGDLDECNGREGATPEYPNGTYYYVLTNEFPIIPRCHKGTPDNSFRPQMGGERPEQQNQNGLRRQPPPPFGFHE